MSSSFLPGQTLYTANVSATTSTDSSSSPSLVLQVTSDGAQLLNSEQLTKLRDTRAHWSPSSDSKHDAHDDGGAAAITSACSAGSSVVVALRGGSLVSLSVAPAASGDSSVLSKRATITLENDISCLDLAAGSWLWCSLLDLNSCAYPSCVITPTTRSRQIRTRVVLPRLDCFSYLNYFKLVRRGFGKPHAASSRSWHLD